MTTIFLLTREHRSLVREITTPSLPGFITSCLSIAKSDIPGPLVETVLLALVELIPHHPTSFRPFVDQIRSLILPLTASTPSSVSRSKQDDDQDEQPTTTSVLLARSSRRLLVLLNVCAPKSTSSESWARSLHAVMEATHATADAVFRAVSEDWESSSTRPRAIRDHESYAAMVSDQTAGSLDLPSWRGIHAGIERLNGLLQTLQAFLATPTSMAVALPVGALLDLLNRVLSMLPPSRGRNTRTNPEISREEREGLWVGLPLIHASAMELLSLQMSRFGHAFAPASYLVFEEVLWVLENEHASSDVRRTTYELTSQILMLFGPSLPKTLSKPLSICIKLCCEDLLPSSEQTISRDAAPVATSKKPSQNGSATINADSYLKSLSNDPSTSKSPTDVQAAAAILLPVLLTHLPPDFLSFSLRTRIDRTAILTQNKQAMLAGVSNPAMKRKGGKEPSSIMPVLARSFPECIEVEALIRPRMPVLQPRRSQEGETESSEEENEDMEFEVPETYNVHKNVNVALVDLQTSSTSMQDSLTSEPRPNLHPPPQQPSQTPELATLEIPETQSFTTNPKKRDVDSTSISQTSATRSNNTISYPPLAPVGDSNSQLGEEATTTSTFPNSKRLRLDQPATTIIPPQTTSRSIPYTQIVQQTSAATDFSAPISSVSGTQIQIAEPALDATEPAGAKEGRDEVESSDDEDFEVPAIDPTMDTDDGESEGDD